MGNSDTYLTDRDIHFNSFAVLLFQEIKPLMNKREQARRDHDYALVQRIEGQIAEVFAHRGYDLVKYVMENTKSGTLETAHFYFDESVSDIPDMTAWPEQSE